MFSPWSLNTFFLVRKAQQRLFFLRKLKRGGLLSAARELLQSCDREYLLSQYDCVVWQLHSLGQKRLGPGGENCPADCEEDLGPRVQRVRCVHTKKWCTLFFTSTIRCIKSEMTVDMCGASCHLHGWHTHFSTAVDSLATLRCCWETVIINKCENN